MGAVTSILFAEKNLTENQIHISSLVLDSPFTSLCTMVSDVAKNKMNLPSFVTSIGLSIIKSTIKSKIDFDITELEPIESAKRLKIPACFILAKNDTLVNPERTIEYYDTYTNESHKVLIKSEKEHNSEREQTVILQTMRFLDKMFGNENTGHFANRNGEKTKQLMAVDIFGDGICSSSVFYSKRGDISYQEMRDSDTDITIKMDKYQTKAKLFMPSTIKKMNLVELDRNSPSNDRSLMESFMHHCIDPLISIIEEASLLPTNQLRVDLEHEEVDMCGVIEKSILMAEQLDDNSLAKSSYMFERKQQSNLCGGTLLTDNYKIINRGDSANSNPLKSRHVFSSSGQSNC